MVLGRAFVMSKPLLLLPLLALSSLTKVAANDEFLYELGEQGRADGLKGTWTAWKKMPMYVSLPSGRTPDDDHRFVIVAHHAVGVYNDNFLREFCDNLAAEGYVCMLPDFFHRVWSKEIPNGFKLPVGKMNIGAQLKSQRDADLLEDLHTAIDFAKDVSGSSARSVRVGVIGFCMGGRVSWLAATAKALSKDVQGVVAYHGGNVWKAYPEETGTAPGDNLQSLHCPVLGHFAGLDQNPSPADKARLEKEGKALGKDMEFYSYAGVKHGFSCRDSSFYDAAAAAQAWPRTLSFLQRVLVADADVLGTREL